MSRNLTGTLGEWLAPGSRQMGEVLIRPSLGGGGRIVLCHVADADRTDLAVQTEPGAAREIALCNETDAFRPLKTAPDLRRGWRLELNSLAAVREALDLFYPAMLGVGRDHALGELPVIPLRGILGRQSGMYAVTKKLGDDQAQELVGSFCRSDGGCLKTILWSIAAEQPVRTLPASKFDTGVQQCPLSRATPLPMLCHEACNLLVAKAREVVKASSPKS